MNGRCLFYKLFSSLMGLCAVLVMVVVMIGLGCYPQQHNTHATTHTTSNIHGFGGKNIKITMKVYI